MPASSSDRYDRVAVVLHWLIAAAVVAEFALGWWMQEIPKEPPGRRADAFNLHKSIGLSILALMLVRVAWRLRHRPPALPPLPPWQALAAKATHVGLYAVLFVQPLAGYLGSVASGYPVKVFGVALPPWGARDAGLKEMFAGVHLACSYALAGLVALHIAAALKHALVDRDGLLSRMTLRRGAPQER